MFPSFLRPPFVTFVTYAIAISPASAISEALGLTVKTSTSNANVDGLENLKVIATVVNTGGETLKLLNDPRSVLNPFPENTFTITNPSGSGPVFDGPKVTYDPTHAAGLGNPSTFTVLAPGGSINVTHDLSDAYDFTRSGFGDYSIEPSNRFTYIDANGTPKNLNATVEGAANVRLSGNLGIPKPPPFVPFTNCTDNQKRVIGTTAIAAQHLASGSYNYIKAMSDPTPRYKAWFGRYSAARKKEVRKIFSRINRKTKFAELTYVCKCLDQGVSSFVYPEYPKLLFICPGFTDLDPGHRAALFVHEASRYTANGGTLDISVGEDAAKELAAYEPANAVHNADNYLYFVENVDSLS